MKKESIMKHTQAGKNDSQLPCYDMDLVHKFEDEKVVPEAILRFLNRTLAAVHVRE
jgi:hypothetical protein